MVRTLLSTLSRRTVAGLIGLGAAAMGPIPAIAQDPKPDTVRPATSTAIRPDNPFLRTQKRRPPIRVTFTVRDSTIDYVLRELSRSAGVRLSYPQIDSPQTDSILTRRVNLSVANVPLMEAMDMILRGTGLQATFVDNNETAIAVKTRIGPERNTDPKMVTVIEPNTPKLSAIPLKDPDSVVTEEEVPEASKSPVAMLAGVITTATGTQRELEVGTRIVSLNVDSIMKIAPITSVTDLLESRVPGLVVQRSSGTPGDPARIRVRGFGSLAQYSDPIIVIDGARMYSRQSDERNLNAGGFINHKGQRTSQYPTPSPLDQIEPSIIERIEVLKGPSASALYGSDAANGVIVITTKRGRAGPTRWVASVDQGIAYMPGVKFDARHTPFAMGRNSATSLSLSGGNSAIQYAYTAGLRNQLGVLKLPDIERERYAARNDVPAPKWMRSPDHLDGLGGNGQVNIQVNPKMNLAFTNLMNSQTQERTSMSNGLRGAYSDLFRQLANGTLTDSTGELSNFYERVSSFSRNFLLSLQVRYHPIATIPINVTFGLGRLMREDKNLVARGVFDSPDSTGFSGSGEGTATERTVSMNAVVPMFNRFSVGMGMNIQYGTVSDLRTSFRNLPIGVTNPSSGDLIEITAPENSWRLFGGFVESKITVNPRLFITPGIRVDNTALSGYPARYVAYPKLSVSWIVSEEPNFPWSDMFPTLRVRGAAGYAGVSPTASDQLEQYRSQILFGFLSQNASSFIVQRQLPIERSFEIEGGVDAEMWKGRLRMDLTYYRRTRNDALINLPLASSLPDVPDARRFGDIQNSGIELGVDLHLLERQSMNWNGGLTLSRNSSNILRLREELPNIFGPRIDVNSFVPEAKNPNYQMAINSGFTLFKGRLGIFTTITYMGGLIQRNLVSAPLLTDTGTVEVARYGDPETVNALRWQTLSVNYETPESITRLLRIGSMSLALQGANLWLTSNYSGLDPNVSSVVSGSATFDTGQIPQPRSWQLRVTVRR